MKGRWIPFLATTAALALAAVAPAQDRGRRGGGGGGGGESRPQRSEPSRREPTRSEPSRREPTRSEPARREPTRSEPERREPTRREPERREPTRSEPTRSEPTRSEPVRTEPTRSEPSRSEPSRTGGDRGDRRNPSSNPGRTSDPVNRDSRPSNGSGESRPSRGGGEGDRRNPLERSSDRSRNDSSNRNDSPNRSERSSSGGDRGVPSSRNRPSRSGQVGYGTRSNGYGAARPVRYGGGLNRNTLNVQIRRTDSRSSFNVGYGGVFGGLRVGYVGYNNYWTDDNFSYPFYVFNPWTPNLNCVASPWYRYSYLPGYVNSSRVIVVNNYVSSWGANDWSNYDYRYNQRDRREEALGNALDDIRDAFERNSVRYAERIIPQTGQVAIFNDGKYDYSLSADDFQDMYLDGVEQSKTVRYEIIESKVRGDEVRVRARHEYVDSWGANQVVFHSYNLRRERDGKYVIREFGTD